MSSDKRGQMMQALARLLPKRPLSKLHTGDIVSEAHTSKRTFYEAFTNKEACFLALYETNSLRVLKDLKDAATNPDCEPLVRLRAGLNAYLATMQEQARLMVQLNVDVLVLGSKGAQLRRRMINAFADLLARQAEEVLAGPDVEPFIDRQIMLAAVAGLNELILAEIEAGKTDELMTLIDTAEALIAGALTAAMPDERHDAADAILRQR